MVERDAAPGIHRIEDAYTNWYLIEDDGRLTIVDAGVRSSWASLAGALRELRLDPGAIEALILTHAHFDHLGFAERARRQFAIPVHVHANDVPLTRHPLQYGHERSRLPYLLNRAAIPIMASLLRSGAFFPDSVSEVQQLAPDGPLPVPGSPRAIFTPGHTLGHCAFHLPDRDALIAGDAIVMIDVYTGLPGPRIVARAATADSARALATLDALAETGAGTVLTGHGPVFRDGAEAAVAAARQAGRS